MGKPSAELMRFSISAGIIVLSATEREIYQFRRSEVQFQQNCLADGKNQEAFQYFKETAAAISLVAENGINILSMQYDKIRQVSEDTVLASYLAPQKEVKVPQMPEAVIYPFGLNQSQKLAVERALSSKISIIQGPPGTGKTQTITEISSPMWFGAGRPWRSYPTTTLQHTMWRKSWKRRMLTFLTAFLGSLANKQKFLETQTDVYPNMSEWVDVHRGTAAVRSGNNCAFQRAERNAQRQEPHCGN